MRVKEESEKAGLKLNVQKTNIMASSLTTSSQIGEKWNQVYVPTTDAKEAEVDWFYEDLQHLLQLTPKIDVEDWNAKVEVKRYLDKQ